MDVTLQRNSSENENITVQDALEFIARYAANRTQLPIPIVNGGEIRCNSCGIKIEDQICYICQTATSAVLTPLKKNNFQVSHKYTVQETQQWQNTQPPEPQTKEKKPEQIFQFHDYRPGKPTGTKKRKKCSR